MGRARKKDNKYDCDYQNAYISLAKKQYPVTAEFLREFGVNIEKPFKVNLLETKDDIIYYSEILYIVLGDKTKFKKAKIGKVKIEIADSYPDTNIKEEHYVIKLSPIAIENNMKIKDEKDKIEIFRTIFNKCTFQAIMFIICSMIAIWGILTTSLAYGIKLYSKMLLVLIIPVIVFGIALYRKYKYRTNKNARSNINWFTTFAILLLPFYYFLTLFFLGIESATTDVTNYKYYKDFMYEELYEVFPKKIPKNAKNISFYHIDPFLQGGEINSLSYKDNSLSQKIVDEKYKSKSIWIGTTQNKEIPEAVDVDNLLERISIDGKKENFTIYVNYARCDDSGYCNHGEYILVAYNDITKEIIFKQEHW